MGPFLIALCAGAASALLVASTATGSALAVPLFYLAPLPILIAGIGWSQLAALVAAGFAALAAGLLFGTELLVAYVAGVGLPAYVLAYLTLMARGNERGELEWFPTGRLVLAAALLGTLAVAALIPLVAGDIASYRAALRELFEAMLQDRAGEVPQDAGRFADLMVVIMPPAAAMLTMLTQLGNLWLAGRIAKASDRLVRPWPDLSAMRLPRGTAVLLLVAFALSLLLDGFLGLIGTLLSATLVIALGLLGFSVLHGLTRDAGGRRLILGTLWISTFVLGWPFLLLAGLGLADLFFDFRSRKGTNPSAANDD
ncbi:YybS family protein [Ancylobacter sp. 6x-1]|uniref:YybS family protein n=1 Tax=Ancylobacter crimeensis TaxID=2579147 RepID=A0ABT0D650_9HYPH|nr:DUF2232 domain-containing protein [Ancylobacter crimeensis]MCK0195414.1 YybS family protein [Ancylobacter crimeensis]